MPKRMTQEEFQNKVDINSHDLYEVISPYQGKNNYVTLKCKKHLCEFTLIADTVSRRFAISCPECKKEKTQSNQVQLTCAYCGEMFFRKPAYTRNSKSGLYFCCREHKDLAQHLEFGLIEIQPEHYGTTNGIYGYRTRVLKSREHKCEVCDYDEDVDFLEVHHIDKDRANNNLSNLIILCSLCHKKVTSNKYKLINNGDWDCMEWSLLLQGR